METQTEKQLEEHPIEERYEHFLNYANLEHNIWLQYAYYHGADVGMERPKGQP